MGAFTIFFGLVGSLVAGVIVDKKRIFKKILVIILLGSMLSGIGFAFILFTKSFVLVAIGASLFGFFIVAILPISYDFGCELTFPVGEAMTGGILNLSGQIVGIVTTLIVGTLTFEPLLANLFNAGVLGIGLISAIFIKEVLLRQRKDKNSLQESPSTYDNELEQAR
jgi:FLVCR family feline leukemia virus subgroup C receptor-related protein